MTTKIATGSVIDLQAHRAGRAAQRRAHQREEAMRRHPSYQSQSGGPDPVLRSV